MPVQELERVCLHFGVCGGCSVTADPPRPLPYPVELEAKETLVRSLLSPFDVREWRVMIPSPEIWHYRNKMEYAFAPAAFDGQPSGIVLGLRQPGRFDRIVDLHSCFLMSEGSFEVLERMRGWARRHGLVGYDRRSHRGQMRYLVLREGKNTNERMAVILATPSLAIEQAAALAELPDLLAPLLTTAWLGLTDAHGDVARATDMRLLWGDGTIEEHLGSLRYRLSPYSFFQTNTRGTEKLYGLLSAWAETIGGGALLDLYCGSGGITLSIAPGFDRVIGIDSNREAIEDARFNAAKNSLTNTEFVTGDVLDFMMKLPASKFAVQLSAVIVDPPRPGLHPKALAALVEMNPPRLAYVSCNPASLARDLQSLSPLYHIQSVQLVDLFPHTPHVETVALLEHR